MAALNQARGTLVIHGGFGFGPTINDTGYLADIWQYGISQKTWSLKRIAAPAGSTEVNQPHRFNDESANIWGSRAFHSAAFDPWSGYMFIFGVLALLVLILFCLTCLFV